MGAIGKCGVNRGTEKKVQEQWRRLGTNRGGQEGKDSRSAVDRRSGLDLWEGKNGSKGIMKGPITLLLYLFFAKIGASDRSKRCNTLIIISTYLYLTQYAAGSASDLVS